MKMDGLGVRHLFTRPNFGGLDSPFERPSRRLELNHSYSEISRSCVIINLCSQRNSCKIFSSKVFNCYLVDRHFTFLREICRIFLWTQLSLALMPAVLEVTIGTEASL